MARTAPRPARGWDTKTFRRHNPSNYPLAFAHFRTLFRRYGACEVLFYALARSYPGLLTKSDPPKRPFGALSRAFGADEIATFTPCPRARPVLRLGHSIGAQVGNFS